MSTPTGDNTSLHELEVDVREELTVAETSQEDGADLPIDQWLSDPADDQRYEVGLRALFGAVETLEDGSRTGHGTPPAESRSES